MNSSTEIGKALSIGMTLVGAAAAGIPEARRLIALLAEAEREHVRRAKCPPSSGDTPDFLIGKVMLDERQQLELADNILRATASSPGRGAVGEGSKSDRVRDRGVRGSWPPGTRANRRRRFRP